MTRTSIGIGVIAFGSMGQAHSSSAKRIPSLFPEREFRAPFQLIQGVARIARRKSTAASVPPIPPSAEFGP